MSTPYNIAADAYVEELEVNRSRFICYLYPCQEADQVKQHIKALQELHPQASHYCYAFVLGRPEDSQKYGFSDDGEPSGTAGKPMLLALQGGGIGQVCAIVVRYFGGTKLGTGGLQRAYGGSVRQALQNLTTKIKIPMVHKRVSCQYNQVNDIQYFLEQVGGLIINQDYGERVELLVALPTDSINACSEKLTSKFSGQLSFSAVDDH